MSKHATDPFSEQVTSVEQQCIPELFASQVNLYHAVFRFNGEIRKANSILMVDGMYVSNSTFLKPNCTCAISQSNKRYLEDFGFATDYVQPNPEFLSSLGFPAYECKQMVYARILDMFPIDFYITGYKEGEKADAPKPEVNYALKNGIVISREEAIKVLADWCMDNDFYSSIYDEMPEFEQVSEAMAFAKISEEAAVYGETASPDDVWKAFEFATLYDLSANYVDYFTKLSIEIYLLLAQKYEKAGILLVNTSLEFGINQDDEIFLGDEVGTPDTSMMASKLLYERYGTLKNMEWAPVMKYLESIADTEEQGQPVPEVPKYVLDEVSDTYMYLAEALSDEETFKLYM